jgi:hypothetical protein
MRRTFAKVIIGCVFAALIPALSVGQHSDTNAPSALTRKAPEPPHLGPANVKVEFENESVLVVRIRMEPHEKTPMHDIASARVVVWLTDTYLRDIAADGRINDMHRSAGAIDWIPARRHAGENLGDKPIEFVAIVPKANPASIPQ